MSADEFGGRVALVTGGSGALGSACAERLAAGGATVALLARGAAELERACARIGERAHAFPADVGDSAQVAAAVAEVERRLGPVDVLVCAAGTAEEPLEVEELSDELWHAMFAANTDGTFFAIRAVLPSMRARDYGRIIAIASVAGAVGNPNEVAYSASKAAVIGMVKSLGKHLAATGIRVHAVAPTVIDSPMGTGPDVPAELVDYLIGQVPIGRPGRREEVADLVAFLAREGFQLSTGATFDLSGGQG